MLAKEKLRGYKNYNVKTEAPESQPCEFYQAERPELRTFIGGLAGALSI